VTNARKPLSRVKSHHGQGQKQQGAAGEKAIMMMCFTIRAAVMKRLVLKRPFILIPMLKAMTVAAFSMESKTSKLKVSFFHFPLKLPTCK